jgi:hypothetical protein
MLHDPAAVRAAYDDAAASFLHTLGAMEPHHWELPGLGVLSVRELAAHTIRAFTTVEMYLNAEPTVDRVMADAGDYYRTVLSDPGIHGQVASRARTAGAQLTDPVGEAEVTVQRVLALVAGAGDDDPVNTFVGQIVLSEYLATRVVELGVHTLDLQRATGQLAALAGSSSEVILAVLTALAQPVPLILALTGRAALPTEYNVLG